MIIFGAINLKPMKRILVFLFVFAALLSAWADEPFRNHRYAAFRALTVRPDNIVMMGNSITNMHEWWEALGDHRILNRGVSGAVSDEMVANLDPILAGHPAQVYIMIGTNDIGYGKTREHIAANLQTILTRFQKESPQTRVHVQSILPSGNGQRGGKIAGTNELLKTVCRKAGVPYIDLYGLLGDGEGHMKAGWSFDDLHPKAAGYAAWCNTLLPYLDAGSGDKHFCQYPLQLPDVHEGRGDSFGARLGTLSQLPLAADDIVFLGDEMIHSGEWHELLGTSRAKNRGTGWGYPGCDMAWLEKEIPHFLHGNPASVCPQTIVLYAGAQEAESGVEAPDFEARYRQLLTLVHAQAPQSRVLLLSVLRNADPQKDQRFTQAYNKILKNIARKDRQATFIDAYTPLCAPEMMEGNYVVAQGYLKLAELVSAQGGL